MKTKTLNELFLAGLGDLYYAEKQLTKALPKLAKAATHDDLREAILAHLTETEGHVDKVERIFEAFGESPKTKRCPAIVGIIDEADDIVSENKKEPTINAAIIYAAQKAEHYEIASYGSLREWAKQLQNDAAANLLNEILDEEKAADAKLTELALAHCNPSAETEAETPMAHAM